MGKGPMQFESSTTNWEVTMAGYRSGGVYERLGVRRVINAWGYNTALGASAPSQEVRDAMDEATGSYVEMRELLEKSGEIIADLLGARGRICHLGLLCSPCPERSRMPFR